MKLKIVALILFVSSVNCSHGQSVDDILYPQDKCYDYKFHLVANYGEENADSVHVLKETIFFIPTKRLVAFLGEFDRTRVNKGMVIMGNAKCYYESKAGTSDRFFLDLVKCEGIDPNGQTLPAGTKIQVVNTDAPSARLNWCWFKIGRAMNPMD